MFLNNENLIQISNSFLEGQNFIDFFAPQEKVRLIELLYNVLSEFVDNHPVNNEAEYDTWVAEAKKTLIKEINESQFAFGVKDLSSKLDLDQFLHQFYEIELNSLKAASYNS